MKWFMNLKTSVKLISSFVVIAIILAMIGTYGISNLSMMNGNIKEMYSNNLISIQSLSQAQISYQSMRVTIRDIGSVTTKAEKDKLSTDVQPLIKDIQDRMDSYRNTTITQAEKDELKNLDTVLPAYQKLFDTALQLAYQDDRNEFIKFKDSEINVAGNKVRDSFNKLIDINVKLAQKTNDTSEQGYESARTITIIVIIIGFLLSILMGYGISRTIAKPLARIVSLVERVSNGDLREKADIDTRDEVGELSNSINQMIGNLQNLIGGIIHSSQSVAAA
jgi:methyl-accepting chemotaxis protein